MGEMLERMSSRELTEWAAYERVAGPVGPLYEQSLLREIHYMQQQQLHAFGSANTDKGKQNPIPKPEHLPAIHEWMDELENEDDDENEGKRKKRRKKE